MEIERLDHIVLTVRDIERTCEFYVRVLGMRREAFGDGRTALRFGRHKINLHPAARPFEPRARRPTPGSADVCLIAAGGIAAVVAELQAAAVAIAEGPVAPTGAEGPIVSVYLRDPDGNLIEIAEC